MPGTDSAQASRIVAGELDVPHVVELPARGPGADMVGRTLALLRSVTGDFGAETTPTGWRLAGGRSGAEPGRAMRRGMAWVGEDLDRLEEELIGFAGTVKLQVVGPWTLAAAVESVRGHRVLADAGLCADLSAALAEVVAGQVADVRRRIPGAEVVVQVDEPSLPTVRAGRVRTPSGRGAVRVPEPLELSTVLERVNSGVSAAGATPVAHCCARQVPFDLFSASGFAGISVDLQVLGSTADEELGRWWESTGWVVLGVAPTQGPPPGVVDVSEQLAREVVAVWHRIGFGVAEVGSRTWVSPSCGLAGAAPDWARSVGAQLRRAGRLLDSAD